MNCYITYDYFEIFEKDICIITNNYDTYEEYLLRNYDCQYIDDLYPIEGMEQKKVLEEVNERFLFYPGMSKEDKMVWCITGGFDDAIGNQIIIQYKYYLQLKQIHRKYEKIIVCITRKNVDLCDVAIKVMRYKKIKVQYSSFLDCVKHKYKHGEMVLWRKYKDIANAIGDLKLVLQVLKQSNKKNFCYYEYGTTLVLNSFHHFEWLMEEIDEIKKFKSYKVLSILHSSADVWCKEARIQYDVMSDWLESGALLKKIREYYRDRRKIRKRAIVALKNGDVPFFLRYQLEDFFIQVHSIYIKACIIENYFKYNSFYVIQPSYTSSGIEARLIYLYKSKMTQLVKTVGGALYQYNDPEFFADIFSYFFFEKIGFDIKPLYDQNNWGKNRVYISVGSNAIYKKWRNKVDYDELGKNRNILVAISSAGGGIRKESDCKKMLCEMIECALENPKYTFSVKFHPTYATLFKKQYEEYLKICAKAKNVFVISPEDSAKEAIQKNDVVITNVSTMIWDTMCDKKPVIVFCNRIEKIKIKYLERNLLLVDNIKNVNAILKSENFVEECNTLVKKQNEYFNGIQDNGVSKMEYLRKMCCLNKALILGGEDETSIYYSRNRN